MNTYEKLLQEASDHNISVHESFDLNGDGKPNKRISGLYIDGNVALDKGLETTAERSCVLAEELGHHYTSVGNIVNMSDAWNRKQERQARLNGYNRLVGLYGLVKAYRAGCHSLHEAANELEVSDEYLQECLGRYQDKYGVCTTFDNYIIYFIPNLAVVEMI